MSNINFFRVLQSGGVGGASPSTWEVNDTSPNSLGSDLPNSMVPQNQSQTPPIFIDASGIKLYVYDTINSKINHGDFATSFGNTSTVTYQESSPSGRFDFTPQGLGFSTDGTKFYVLKQSSGAASDTFLYQATLSTAWDISTMSKAPES